MERIKTGIYGLDQLIEGGFPKNRIMLTTGATGTGKSIFSLQFLYKGALDYGEPGVYVTFDEMPSKIREDVLGFGWNLNALEKKKLFTIIDASSARAGAPSEEDYSLLPGELNFDKVLIEVLSVCRSTKAKRLVFDSIPSMAYQFREEQDIRKAILKLGYIVSRAGLTTIITSEVAEHALGSGAMVFSKFGVEEYVADGVILLSFLGIGEHATRTLYIRKIRGSKHSLDVHPMDITDKGIVVKRIEEMFK